MILSKVPINSAAVDKRRKLPESSSEVVSNTTKHESQVKVISDTLLEQIVHLGRGRIHLFDI